MSAPKHELLQAVELALAGDWDAAHQLVQRHAVLHKIEGDLGNARYWYHRADRMEYIEDEPREELVVIQAELGHAAMEK
jgi:dihydrodipicolinate synthase/N-acetylneuraminate lyase